MGHTNTNTKANTNSNYTEPHLLKIFSNLFHTMPSSSLTILPVLVATFSLSKCAPSSPACIHQTSTSTSRWHQLVNSDQRQTRTLTGSHHMTNLQDRLGELVEMITVRRESFCQESLGQTFAYLVNLLTEMEVNLGSNSPTLTMAALPPSLRCEAHSVRRNQRDFIILRHVLHAASFFTATLNSH